MKRTIVAVVFVVVAVSSRFSGAQTSKHRPSVADMRAALERGDSREALKLNTNALRLRGEAARGFDQYELLMVRGEALMAVGLPLESEDAYEHAVHVAKGLKERAAAHAESLLARQAAERVRRSADGRAAARDAERGPQQAAARHGPPPTPEARRRAMRDQSTFASFSGARVLARSNFTNGVNTPALAFEVSADQDFTQEAGAEEDQPG